MKRVSETYENGKTTVVLNGSYGIATGVARIHPDDKEFYSNFFGNDLAEQRARVNYLKNIYKKKKEEYEACKTFVNTARQYKNFDNDSSTAKVFYRQLNMKLKELCTLEKEIHMSMSDINLTLEVKNKINDKIANKGRSKEDNI